MCISVCLNVYITPCVHGVQKKFIDTLQLELQVVVSDLCVLKTEPNISAIS